MFLISKSINYIKENVILLLKLLKQFNFKKFDSWSYVFSLILCPLSVIFGIITLVIFVASGKFTDLNMNQEIYNIYFNNWVNIFFVIITILAFLLSIISYFKNSKKGSVILFISLIVGAILTFSLAIYFAFIKDHNLKMICVFSSIILLLISIYNVYKSDIHQIKYSFFGTLWIYLIVPTFLYFMTNIGFLIILLVILLIISIGKTLIYAEPPVDTLNQHVERVEKELQELKDVIKKR